MALGETWSVRGAEAGPPLWGPGPVRSGLVTSARATAVRRPQFEHQCDLLLEMVGFELGRGPFTVPEVGVEVDREAVSPSGRTMWFEYRGSLQGVRPGLRRTDAVKQSIAHGALLAHVSPRRPFVVLTSHQPGAGAGQALLKAAGRMGYVDAVVCIYEHAAQRLLRSM